MNLLHDLREAWSYRYLLQMLVWRDLKARYKSSVLGIAWSFLQPMGMTAVLSLAFGIINRGNTAISAYPVFILSGLLAWNFFSTAILSGTGSVVNNGALVKKVYFPRVLLPISSVISGLINFVFALPIFFIAAAIYGFPLHESLLWLPLVILIQVIFSIGLSLMLATLNVFYRDTQFILELAMQALFFLTPLWYDINTAGSMQRLGVTVDIALWIHRLNPMASLVNIYQDLMYRGVVTTPDFWLRTMLTAIFVLVFGYWIFQKYSPRFGEEV